MDVTCGVYSRAATIRSAAFIRGNTVRTHTHTKKTTHKYTRILETVRPKSKQGNTTNLNISFSSEKRAAQVGFEPTTYSTACQANTLNNWAT